MVSSTFSNAETILKNYEKIVISIKEKKEIERTILSNSIIIILCSIFYGAILGTFVLSKEGVFTQIGLDAIKMPILLMITFLISIPIFYFIDSIVGNKIELLQTIALVSVGFVAIAIGLIVFIPVLLFFIISAPDYYFISFLNIGICGLSGYIGLIFLIKSYKKFHENENWYQSVAVGCFIIAFVGTQLSWTLRPFLKTHEEFQGNNFYVFVFDLAGKHPTIATIFLLVFIFIAFILTIMYLPRLKEKTEGEIRQPQPSYPYFPFYNPYQQISQQAQPIKEENKEKEKTSTEEKK